MRHRSVSKGEIILRSDESADCGIFILDGIVRIYNFHEGREYTRNFFTSGDFFTESASYFTGNSHGFLIDALSPGEIFLLHRDNAAELMKVVPSLGEFYLRQLERALVFLTRRSLENQLSGAERFRMLQKTRAHLLEKIPQFMLASYLGLSPEAYSRIKSQVLDEDQS